MPETWWLPSPDGEGTLVLGAHGRGECDGPCPLHAPSAHWASGMPMRWAPPARDPFRPGRMQRLCPHGHWHDDPDDLDFRLRRGTARPSAVPCACDCPCDCPWEPPF